MRNNWFTEEEPSDLVTVFFSWNGDFHFLYSYFNVTSHCQVAKPLLMIRVILIMPELMPIYGALIYPRFSTPSYNTEVLAGP